MSDIFPESHRIGCECWVDYKYKKQPMSLVQIWKENPEQIRAKRVDQIIGFAGDGKLGDNNTAPIEIRDFLTRVPGELISSYANDCLENPFKDSGLALQDIVNEIASRLGFKVEPGRYRGTKNDIGHDGIWTTPNNHEIVAEVKTTMHTGSQLRLLLRIAGASSRRAV